MKVTVPLMEEVREAYIEVKEAATKEVIITFEILSPTNKRGEGRQKYEEKRQRVLSSRTHLVEIDLLRDGEPLPVIEKFLTLSLIPRPFCAAAWTENSIA